MRLFRQPPSAAPTACRNWVPVQEDFEMRFKRFEPQWEGICRPAEAGSAVAPTAWRNIS